MKTVDLGVCEGLFFPADPENVAIVLPGAGYSIQAPVLWFAREALLAENWSGLLVDDRWDQTGDPNEWALTRMDAALEEIGDVSHRLVVAKSLTSLALPRAVEESIPGIWLTPLLGREEVRDAMSESAAPTLAVGGTADPTWDSEFAASLSNVEVLEIEGADHSLQPSGGPSDSLDALQTVTDHISRFVDRLPLS